MKPTIEEKLKVNTLYSILCNFTYFCFINSGRWYATNDKWYVLVYQGIVTMFVLMNFSLATFMDPGVIPRGNIFTMLVLGSRL